MPRKLLFSIALFASALVPIAAKAGPFGTEMGDDIKKFSAVTEIKPYIYSVNELPKTHSAFESYTLKSHPTTGLCQVAGFSSNFENDRYGENVRASFSQLREQLNSIYGQSQLFDYLNSGALWKGKNEWVMAISKNERQYQAAWTAEKGKTMKDNVVEVLLTVKAVGSDSARFVLQYRYSNIEDCDKAISNSAAGAL